MRTATIRIATVIAALVAVVGFGVRPGQAQYYGDAPWCAVLQIGTGAVVWHCYYRSAEECAPNVISGNRGSCNVNPYYQAGSAGAAARPKYQKRHPG